MRIWKCPACILCLAAVGLGPGQARGESPGQNQPAAFLVFPAVLTEQIDGQASVETFLTITNVSSELVGAHVALFDGDSCSACEFDLELQPRATRTLVATRRTEKEPFLDVRHIDGETVAFCPPSDGFVTVNLQSPVGGTRYENVLVGHEVVTDYPAGRALSVPALTIQRGTTGGSGDRRFDFDGAVYRQLPLSVGGEFIAPNRVDDDFFEVGAFLSLFTLGFTNGKPPASVCDVTVRDAGGNRLSSSIAFGCWTHTALQEIDLELVFPFFGAGPDDVPDDHGWLEVQCDLDTDGDGEPDSRGGVHGAISQFIGQGASLLRLDDGIALETPTAWGRLLQQGATLGDPVELDLQDGASLLPVIRGARGVGSLRKDLPLGSAPE